MPETSENLSSILQPNGASVLSGQVDATSGYGDMSPITPGRTDLRSIIEGSLQADEETLPQNAGPEVITQRYPNGKPQLIKQVAQDAEGNYYDHGEWKVLNLEGEVLAKGQFKEGVMDGVWTRLHPPNSDGIFATRPFNLFKGPFTSTATFSEGNLDGIWTLQDAFERKIFEIPYRNGVRHGTATWWFPNAVTMREVTFKNGLIDGPLREWDDQNKLVRYEEFIDGKKIIRHTTFYRPQQRQEENFYLDGKLELTGDDDWWKAQPASFQVTTPRVQHGPASAWYDNDQPKMKGQYRNNVRVGRFTWWHPNGQKALEGNYNDEGQKVGDWTWWHTNGIKSIQGPYNNDVPTGVWTWWETDGQVKTKEDMDNRRAESSDAVGQAAPMDARSRDDNRDPSLTKPDDFDALEEIEPYSEGSIDILPGKLVPDESGMDATDPGNDNANSDEDPFGDFNSDDGNWNN